MILLGFGFNAAAVRLDRGPRYRIIMRRFPPRVGTEADNMAFLAHRSQIGSGFALPEPRHDGAAPGYGPKGGNE
jgi:hypothetical protein